MHSSSTFIRLSGLILEVEKSALINDYEVLLRIAKMLSKARSRQTSVVCNNLEVQSSFS